MDAKRSHDKSELEQIKQDIASASKQKLSISRALEKKVYGKLYFSFFFSPSAIGFLFIQICISYPYILAFHTCRKNHLQILKVKLISSRLEWQ